MAAIPMASCPGRPWAHTACWPWHVAFGGGGGPGTASPGVGLQAELILMGRWYLQQMENGISVTVSVKDLFSQWIPSHYGRTQPRNSCRQGHTRVRTLVCSASAPAPPSLLFPLSPLNSYGAQARVWGAFLPHCVCRRSMSFLSVGFLGGGAAPKDTQITASVTTA